MLVGELHARIRVGMPRLHLSNQHYVKEIVVYYGIAEVLRTYHGRDDLGAKLVECEERAKACCGVLRGEFQSAKVLVLALETAVREKEELRAMALDLHPTGVE